MKTSSRTKNRRWIVILGAVLILIPAAYFGARKVVWPAYRDWRSARLDRLAQQFIAAGDYDKALLTVRNNLRDNQGDLVGWRLAASIAKSKNSSEVVYYLDHIAQLEKTLPSRLEAARAALQHGYVAHAIESLAAAGIKGNDNADFHQLAAEAYTRNGEPAEAKKHLAALVRLRPGDGGARLDFAEMSLRDTGGRADADLRASVRQVANQDSGLRIRALALLLAEAVVRGADAESVALADELKSAGPLSPGQRILVLRALASGAPVRADAYRATLESEFATDADQAAALLRYYAQSRQFDAATRWHRALGDKVRVAPTVMQEMADVWIAQRDWPTVSRALATANWGPKEYVRHADLAHVARATGLLSAATDEWKLAVLQAGDTTRKASDLIARATAWGWNDERFDVLWKLFALLPRSPGVREPLIAWERRQGNTANLNRIYARILEVEPDNRQVKNDFAYTSLLLDANLGRASRLAAENFHADPHNPYYATVQSLALYKQGKPREALGLVNALDAAARSEPERCLYRAVYHAALGEAGTAADLVAGLPRRRFLPEEEKLKTLAAATAARAEKTNRLNERFAAGHPRNAAREDAGWLRLLPDLRATATPAMRQADEFYAAADLPALLRALREANWPAAEHVRLSLLAYARRAGGSEAEAREAWRAALGDAGRAAPKLRQLADLAGAWQWRAERIEALERYFEREPRDRALLGELLAHHRTAGHTADLARVLAGYVAANPADETAAGEFAYYSMLCDSNLSRAYVAAKSHYDSSPTDPSRQLVYAFALWKQKRAAEAWTLLENHAGATGDVVPGTLLRVALLADLGRSADARREIESYNPERPLPEEVRLATALRRKLAQAARVTGLL